MTLKYAALLPEDRSLVYNRRAQSKEEEAQMKKITIAFLAAMSLASFGCKKKGAAGEAMAKMDEFKTKMCACKEHDTKCAQAVTDDMTKWSQEMAKNAGDKKADDMSPE